MTAEMGPTFEPRMQALLGMSIQRRAWHLLHQLPVE